MKALKDWIFLSLLVGLEEFHSLPTGLLVLLNCVYVLTQLYDLRQYTLNLVSVIIPKNSYQSTQPKTF